MRLNSYDRAVCVVHALETSVTSAQFDTTPFRKSCIMHAVHHRYAIVEGYRLFYREAGPVNAPIIVLLHGYPTSSFMFRDLIPRLAARYRIIAPDHLGFGLSDAPPVTEFTYTFDTLADLTAGLLDHLGADRYAIYVQDYGAPIGWRLTLRDPQAVTAIITQNGNAYEAGFVEDFWKSVWAYAQDTNETTETELRAALGIDAIRWQYLNGEPDQSLISPDTWHHDLALVSRPGNDLVQLALFRDYITNLPLYPLLHQHLRVSGVPLLAVWGRNDEIFGPEGAQAFAEHAADPEIHLIDGGHFLLESNSERIADLMNSFLDRRLD